MRLENAAWQGDEEALRYGENERLYGIQSFETKKQRIKSFLLFKILMWLFEKGKRTQCDTAEPKN